MNKKDVGRLLASKPPKVGQVKFIAIDGHGGSGKSTLANLIAQKLKAEIIHTDDFAAWNNPFNWWPLVIQKVFKPIKEGSRILNYTRSKWWENHNPEPVVDQQVTEIMILEGVSSLRKEFRNYISLGIYVDAPRDLCLKRGIEKDTGTDKSAEELTKIWNEWVDEEDEYFERDNPKSYADIVIDGTRPFEDQLQQLNFLYRFTAKDYKQAHSCIDNHPGYRVEKRNGIVIGNGSDT